ncbi:MAG: DUF3596 domain-containing protein [Deltaproteobacteria bacterium]|nr:DUF3596 domain-containing protein [Deltaproteobacteria bacterium]
MKHSKIIEISGYRKKIDKKKEGDRLNDGKKGRVYSRGGKLWVDFYYLGERVREPSGLEDTPPSRIIIRKQLDLVMAEIVNGVFEFAKRFPNSKRKDYFSMLEGRILRKEPEDILFKDYVDRWWEEMEPGMSESQIRDYTTILKTHHMPYFSKMRFSEICSKLRMKKYVAHLKGKKTPLGKPLSATERHDPPEGYRAGCHGGVRMAGPDRPFFRAQAAQGQEETHPPFHRRGVGSPERPSSCLAPALFRVCRSDGAEALRTGGAEVGGCRCWVHLHRAEPSAEPGENGSQDPGKQPAH